MVVNRALSSLHGGSLEIKITAPLRKLMNKVLIPFGRRYSHIYHRTLQSDSR